MKQYRVVFTVTPATRIKGNIQLNFEQHEGDFNVEIFPLEVTPQKGNPFQAGWLMRVHVWADSIDNAIFKAEKLVNGILSVTCLFTSVKLSIVQPDLVYEITPNVEKREFLQLFRDVPVASRRELPWDLFIEIVDKLLKPPNPEYIDRISRALRWYRMGVLQIEDVITRYDCFWKGLESLNKPLAEVLSAPDVFEKCSKCGHKRKIPTTNGIKEFITINLDDGE